MLRLLRYEELDLDAWDACVEAAGAALPYACSWWLHSTAGRWDALVEQEPATGRYLAVWPLPVKVRPWGREVFQPPFTQQLGWFTIPGHAPVALDDDLVTRLRQRYTRFYTQLNDGSPLSTSVQEASSSAKTLLAAQERYTYCLGLESSYAALQAKYAADYRRRLRRSQTAPQPLQVENVTDAEPLIRLFQQTKGLAAGLRPRHYQILRRLVAQLQHRGLLALLEVRHPETRQLLAGAVFVHYHNRLIYLFAAASEEGKKADAPLLLLDQQIQQHAGTPGLILDFEGGMIPSIARFFANFGAIPVPYLALSFTKRPRYLSWLMR